MTQSRHNPQTISWFWDLYRRGLLNLDPPYQRRSVWNTAYREYFIDTLLLEYPAPALFLFSEVAPDGSTKHSVVDGKQRLLTIFDFVDDRFPVGDKAQLSSLRGKYFSELDSDVKVRFWSYQFSVEHLPTADEDVINSIFDRINRNVAKLTAQELRHARFDGPFIALAEELAAWLTQISPDFPRIAQSSRNQMKDVEFVANLLLLLDEGPKSYSVDELDRAFSDRDTSWDSKATVEAAFRDTHQQILAMLNHPDGGSLKSSRLRNQADYYSLFGAVANLRTRGTDVSINYAVSRLVEFVNSVENSEARGIESNSDAQRYYDAARSASNLAANRKLRIDIIFNVISGVGSNVRVAV